jgi:hypothetical protein
MLWSGHSKPQLCPIDGAARTAAGHLKTPCALRFRLRGSLHSFRDILEGDRELLEATMPTATPQHSNS